jgi:hypothetical protein
MGTNVPETLRAIASEIAERGSANLTRLVVMKKWFERSPRRLKAFAVWIARRALFFGERTPRGKAERLLFRQARALFRHVKPRAPRVLNRRAAQSLRDRLWEFQNKVEGHGWRSVRVIGNWDLLLVEEALDICLLPGDRTSPSDGYKLAADYCQHYDSRYGNGLTGPSRWRILALARFAERYERMEEKRR